MAASPDGAWSGFGDAHDGGTLGVPPGAQLACYPRATPANQEDDPVRAASGGAHYIAHRDGVERGCTGLGYALTEPAHCMRELTCILYMTDAAPGWTSDDARPSTSRVVPDASAAQGGALVLHLGADPRDTSGAHASSVVEILPIGGRLVIFDSRSVLHEVRPHSRADVDRVAMTIWVGGPYRDSLASLARHCSRWWLPAWGS